MVPGEAIYPGYLPLEAGGSGEEPGQRGGVIKVNGHIHTPHSFSAFRDMDQPFRMAREEGISVLGINDFNTTGGYGEFAGLALEHRVFPLFNIEFMALQKEEQRLGIRVNDPVNPGRTYLSGKGLRYPERMGAVSAGRMASLQTESNLQTRRMVEKLNHYLEELMPDLRFDADDLQRRLARNMLRERHIATAIRQALFDRCGDEEAVRECLTLLYGGKKPAFAPGNQAALENEIRNNLLKSGGPAYVEEDEKAFLSLETVREIILDAGGIPCYPVLLDDARGNFTGFEADWPEMAASLAGKGITMVELIPGRNDFRILKDFVTLFRSLGFVITFGTEHNSPLLEPLTVCARGGVALDEELLRINEEGAAIVAAHQYLTAHGLPAFPAGRLPAPGELRELAALGRKVIARFINR